MLSGHCRGVGYGTRLSATAARVLQNLFLSIAICDSLLTKDCRGQGVIVEPRLIKVVQWVAVIYVKL